VGLTDAFKRTTTASITIDNYVDGISLTRGSQREHIWTFAAGANNDSSNQYTCPCSGNNAVQPPPFVETDYFCETGNYDNKQSSPVLFFSADPLWNGEGCGAGSTMSCCDFNTPPWFYKELPQPTTDDIEMRVCTDEKRNTEDIAIEIIYIYIQ
jgi:hypothetical protein